MRSSVEAHLERAFALAYFFHPDRETALGIAGQAVTKLRVAERTQGRRAYYRPVGRRLRYDGLIARSRTKVSVERAHMLQRLVLHECDAVEHEQEARSAAALGDDDFALRYVKQLVRLGTRRSSLYVAVATGRILYGYSTAEVQELIGSVMQDPERVPEDSYLRHVKGGLFDELRSRFGELLRVRTGARGEESFDSAPPSPPQRRLVARCLELLTPWDTACLVPAGFDALSHPLEPFRFSGTDPDDEHAIEVNRMHALIDPGCIERLAGGLRLPSPAARLAVPRPFRSSDLGGGRGPGGDRERPPELEQNDLDRLGALWSRRDQRRRGAPMARLSVRVDGIERLRFQLEIGATAHCDLGAGADVVEVWGETATGPEVLLAVHLPRLEPFGSREPAAHEEWVIEVGRPRELLLVLRRQADDGGHARLRLDVRCRETSRLAWLTRAWRAPVRRGDPAGPVRWLGAAGAAAAVGVGALLALVLWRGSEGGASRPSVTPPESTVVGERTRGESAPTRTTTLATARRIYLGSLAGPDGEHVAELLRRELRASGRFEPTSDVEAADAAIKVELVPPLAAPDAAGGTVGRLRLRLVDERGVVLWSADESGPSWEVMAARAIAALAQAAGG